MSNNFIWGAQGSSYALLTTELNSLATGSGSALGPEIDNTANAWQMGRLWLHIASNSLAFTSASYVRVYFLTSNAGSTYATYTSGASYALAEQNYYAGTVYINPKTQSANVVEEYADYIPIPLGKFKTVLVSQAGVTLPSTLNTLTIFPTPSAF